MNLHYVLVIIFITFLSTARCDNAVLFQHLKQFQIIEADSIRIEKTFKKRYADASQKYLQPDVAQNFKRMTFEALNRTFRMNLVAKNNIFASDFKVIVVNPISKTKELVSFNQNEFLHGNLENERNIQIGHVSAHIDSISGVLTAASIIDDDVGEVYMIEPSWRFYSNDDMQLYKNVSSLVVYRESDIIVNDQVFSSGLSFDTDALTGNSPYNVPRCREQYVKERVAAFKNMKKFDSDNDEKEKVKKKRATAEQSQSKSDNSKSFSYTQNDDSPQSLPTKEPAKQLKKNRCSLKLIADYRFFNNIGGRDIAVTIRYLIGLIDRVNMIFTRTVWQLNDNEPGITNMGFIVKSVEVLDHYTPITSNIPKHYNMEHSDEWKSGELLELFCSQEGTAFQDYCLVHLFTYRQFTDGVLGLGYIPMPVLGTQGGICSPPMPNNDGLGLNRFPNVAFTSCRSRYGGAVVTREADLVTAHELGHNWGSNHDVNTKECSPSSSKGKGGPYIMYMFSVSGYERNNRLFSPCSRRSIYKVLEAKSEFCFVEEPASFCGNQIVEDGEECDSGLAAKDRDPCCYQNCTFRPGAVCNPKNSPCCTSKCLLKSKGDVCLQPSPRISCRQGSVCTGKSAECPEPLHYEDGAICRNDGKCFNGTCLSFCERHDINRRPCLCEEPLDACYRCCLNANETVCRPYVFPDGSGPLFAGEGARCIHGYCTKDKVCVKEVQDLAEHIWSIFRQLDRNAFGLFLRDNLVMTVIFLSLLLWIPLSCVVNNIDKKQLKAQQEYFSFNPDTDTFNACTADKRRIEVVRGVKTFDGAVLRSRSPQHTHETTAL